MNAALVYYVGPPSPLACQRSLWIPSNSFSILKFVSESIYAIGNYMDKSKCILALNIQNLWSPRSNTKEGHSKMAAFCFDY